MNTIFLLVIGAYLIVAVFLAAFRFNIVQSVLIRQDDSDRYVFNEDVPRWKRLLFAYMYPLTYLELKTNGYTYTIIARSFTSNDAPWAIIFAPVSTFIYPFYGWVMVILLYYIPEFFKKHMGKVLNRLFGLAELRNS